MTRVPARPRRGPAPGTGLARTLTVDEMAERYLAGMTLEAIGAEAGVSRERVRQLLPADVKREARARRRARITDRLRELIAAGRFLDEIGDEMGYSGNTAVWGIIDHHGLMPAWRAAEYARRLRRGYCRVCAVEPVLDHPTAVTCGGFCAEAWRVLRYRIDADERAKHRVAIARWDLANGAARASETSLRRVVDSGGRDVASQGTWFLEGSRALAIAAECVRRGYRPVVDALTPAEYAQAWAYLEETR